MQMNKLRCAIVGLGRIGSLLEQDTLREKPATHAGVIAQNPDCMLVGGCDIDKKRQKLFSTTWQCKNVYSDVATMLGETKPDILHIATPVETHLDIVEKAVSSGIKVIICEKPLAENKHDASKIAKFHSSGIATIIVNHERRYSKDYLTVKDHINKGDFGILLSLSAKLYMGKNRKVNDILLDDGTHLIDIIHFLIDTELGKLNVEKCYKKNQQCLYIVADAGDIPVVIEVASGRDHVVFELDLSFSEGRIRVGNGTYEEYESGPSPYYEGMRSLLKNDIQRPFPTGYFANMMADAVGCVRDKHREPVSSAIDGYKAIAFIDSVKEEAQGV
jgi:predicted dehydrogenase